MRFLFFVIIPSTSIQSIHPGTKEKKKLGREGGLSQPATPGDVGAMRCGCGSVPGARMSESDFWGLVGEGEGEEGHRAGK